ncbi:MAG: hypothetical protein WCF68_06605 [Terriglobales bacterium]
MQEKASITEGEYDLARPEVRERAACDLDPITGPKHGQHAFPVNAQAHAPTRTAAAQNIRHQSGALCARGVLQFQEVFCEN